jgi:hypothetical protein
MEKRWLKFTGAVELPEGIDTPELGSSITAEIEATVTGDHKDKSGPEGEKSPKRTTVAVLDNADITAIAAPPEPDPELPLDGEGDE